MSDLGKTPLETAERLAKALDRNTDALDKVRRRYRLTLALVILVASTLVSAVKFNYDGTVARCKAGNELRDEIDSKWQAVSDFLEASGVGDTPGEKNFLNVLSSDLERRDCSEINWLGR